jgi:microcystin-dependent protein
MDPILGQIKLLPYAFVPMGWMLCNGAILNIQQNTALFSLIGNRFGGNGTTTFALPNLITTSPVSGMEYYIAVQGLYPPRS